MMKGAAVPRLSHILRKVQKSQHSRGWMREMDEAHLSVWLHCLTASEDLDRALGTEGFRVNPKPLEQRGESSSRTFWTFLPLTGGRDSNYRKTPRTRSSWGLSRQSQHRSSPSEGKRSNRST